MAAATPARRRARRGRCGWRRSPRSPSDTDARGSQGASARPATRPRAEALGGERARVRQGGLGAEHLLGEASDSINFRESPPDAWQTRRNRKGGGFKSPRSRSPLGYFEGESMTRRTAFTIGGAGGRRRRRRRRSSCPRSASRWRRSSTAARSAGRRSARPATSSKTPTARSVFTETEGIGDAGKTTAYVRRGSAELGRGPGKFIAVSNRCAHLGCPVRFVEAAGNFICPCHGGVYDFQGKRHRRPAGAPARPVPDPGPRRPGRVGPRYSVTSQLEPVRARDPGEFTGGIWEYLYPPRPSPSRRPDGEL